MLGDDGGVPEYDAEYVTHALDAAGGPGATALLHGILATLTEALDRLDGRLDGLERRFDELAAVEDEPLPEPPPPPPPVDLSPIEEGLTELGRAVGAVADRPVEVHVDVDLDRVVSLLDEHAGAVRAEVARLEMLIRGQVAEVAGRTGAITEVVGRLDGRLHEVVDGVRVLQRRSDEPVRLTAVGGTGE